ncbi:hypothetical protein [Sphingomonas immobilis]|uniref:DUF2157 domain-containing protein n=1 Tax=Sphingomonas immobilis TaxID=3063997 RepID=A0ABT8ZUN8_9SPHN|nr:hypothetical protein [Sphingomonas sp. CA1-15]MDO7840978.1 hypothetical protein [Sphingomonas sp. CA1-15]
MYSDSDLEGAVTAGAISREAADALRHHIAAQRATPIVDEEQFRLLSGFNDIFVSIAIVMLLTALAQLGKAVATPVAGVLVAGAAWGLAEYFTRVRRMALPSILLLLAFVGGVAGALVGVMTDLHIDIPARVGAVIAAGIALITGGAAWLHWRRFMVPITVAAGAAAAVAVVAALTVASAPEAKELMYPTLLICGFVVFALAMWWDISDRERRTRRSDVAFWLHLAAAPLIAHPVFHMLGMFQGDISMVTAIVVIVLYVIFGFVALAIDRRALLVSSLAYVLYAMYSLLQTTASLELAWGFTALAIGSALLTLSAFWHPMRALVVGGLGDLAERLPPVGVVAARA